MKNIFESREFSRYHISSIAKSRSSLTFDAAFPSYTTVFLSHKHDDLDDLKDIIGFLETTYKVRVYIDSRDPNMPAVTSPETAKNIKERIRSCDKFILLATNGAIESKWCNWELGYGDALKYEKNKIALFPLKPKGSFDKEYKGSEYMKLYPHISYYNGTEKYDTGKLIPEGYYVGENKEGKYYITPLGKWLMK